jgi:hypothetical protein
MSGAVMAETRPDRRRHAWREDLAADALRGIVAVPRYVRGESARIIVPVTPVRSAPCADAGLDTEALLGAAVTVYDVLEGWAWVQLERDRYVGYVPKAAIGDRAVAPTHRVAALGTFVFPTADMKRPPTIRLTLGAEVTVVARQGDFHRLAGGGFAFCRHLCARDDCEPDFVAVAERLIGVPYLWGGRTPLGCDCSGLVQLALEAAGIDAPRDSDMQAGELGVPLSTSADLGGLRRGDLVCWPGHIGIMRDGVTLLHANAHHMAVASEPLADALTRIAATGTTPSTVRRLPGLGA